MESYSLVDHKLDVVEEPCMQKENQIQHACSFPRLKIDTFNQ